MYQLYVFFRYADCWICNTWCKDTKKKIKESSRSGNL